MGATPFDFDHKRDAYGFAVRPQHLQRFREYAKIYKEEEDERAHRWKDFLDRLADSADLPSTPGIDAAAAAAAAGDAESAEKSVKEEEHEAENTDTNKNLEHFKGDSSEESREVNGEPGDIKGVTSNLEKPKEDSSNRGADCDGEEEGEVEAAERNIKIECVDEVDDNAESIEAKGKPEDSEDVTGNSEKLKEESSANCVTLNKASEELKETNEGSEEIKVINGGSDEYKDQNDGAKALGEVNNDNFKRFEEIPFDKGLLDELEPIKVESWRRVRASLSIIENMMSSRVVKRNDTANAISEKTVTQLASIEEDRTVEETHEENPAEESYDAEKVDRSQDRTPGDSTSVTLGGDNGGSYFPWREELESLVRGGVPIALRGEMWQAFVGVGARKITGYYNKLLDERTDVLDEKDLKDQVVNEQKSSPKKNPKPEKWKGQIEKDLPRTFPGHPALDEDGRNALRRLLTAYARHNPSVGYCQAMNFFAGLFLLFMPEENAFWALVGVIDEYFEGYYTEEMIESQVDQLVLEDVVRERFPKLAKHTDILGVQVTWVTGPWFLSIFINMLPWESGQVLYNIFVLS